MKSRELREKWPAVKKRIKEEHPEISDNDLFYEIGKETELLKRLQVQLGKNKREIDNWLAFFGG
jgi:hypothetical protein